MAFDNTAPGAKTVSSTTYDNEPAIAKTPETMGSEVGGETAVFTDSFTGTDGANVSSAWIIFPGSASILTILSNQAVGVGGPPAGAIVDSPTMADGFCSVETHGLAHHNHTVIAREQGSGFNYQANLVDNALTLYRRIGGGGTVVLAGPASAPFVTGAVLKIQAIGRTIRVFYDDVEVLSHIDNSADAVLGAGKWGISALTSASKFDNFRMGAVITETVEVEPIELDSTSYDNAAPEIIAV